MAEAMINILPYQFQGNWMVGPRSFLMDRIVPQVELIYWPGGTYGGGELRLCLGSLAQINRAPRPTRANRVKFLLGGDSVIDLGRDIAIDLRRESYFNWSHQLNQYLPICLCLRHTLAENQIVSIIVHERMPDNIITVYEHFGFRVISTDHSVKAIFLDWSVNNRDILSSQVHLMVKPHLDSLKIPESSAQKFPKRIFLSRKSTRYLLNNDEIESILAEEGFTTIYAEDYSGLDQISLLGSANYIVAIHGAALAPLLYRRPNSKFNLIELFPPGHMTGFFRMMCHQVGGSYVAVRGRLKPSYIPAIYNTGPFFAHSLDAFEVDPESLRIAMKIMKRGDIIDDYPDRW